MSFSVIVGTFGDLSWAQLAQDRAVPSVIHQTAGAEVIHVHGTTLDEARNAGAAKASGDWLIFLDADDELDAGYVEAMGAAAEDGCLLQPATVGVHADGRVETPVLIPQRPLMTGNFMVIGTAVQRELFTAAGGFRDLPIYEDWDLWIRCCLAGARPKPVADAHYRVHVSDGRNSQTRDLQIAWFNRIRNDHLAAARVKGWKSS